MSTYPQIWVTNEKEPRELLIKGVSGIDPDCLVAYVSGQRAALWVIRDNGYVIGLAKEGTEDIIAKPKETVAI